GWLGAADGRRLAVWLAALNLMALAFALAEFILGVPTFFPANPVTEIVLRSADVGGNSAFRIPACFANAHSYSGTMTATVPWLVGALVQPRVPGAQRLLVGGGLFAALLGNFLAATRINLGVLVVYVLVATLSGQFRRSSLF